MKAINTGNAGCSDPIVERGSLIAVKGGLPGLRRLPLVTVDRSARQIGRSRPTLFPWSRSVAMSKKTPCLCRQGVALPLRGNHLQGESPSFLGLPVLGFRAAGLTHSGILPNGPPGFRTRSTLRFPLESVCGHEQKNTLSMPTRCCASLKGNHLQGESPSFLGLPVLGFRAAGLTHSASCRMVLQVFGHDRPFDSPWSRSVAMSKKTPCLCRQGVALPLRGNHLQGGIALLPRTSCPRIPGRWSHSFGILPNGPPGFRTRSTLRFPLESVCGHEQKNTLSMPTGCLRFP